MLAVEVGLAVRKHKAINIGALLVYMRKIIAHEMWGGYQMTVEHFNAAVRKLEDTRCIASNASGELVPLTRETKKTCSNCGRKNNGLIPHDGKWWCPGACVITTQYPGSIDGKGGSK